MIVKYFLVFETVLLLNPRKFYIYLRWNERHLRAYFETLMTLLQTERFLLQAEFLYETDQGIIYL